MTEPPDQIEPFRIYVREFIQREIVPHADAWTHARSVPRALHEAAGAAGLYSLKYPVEWGGLQRPYAFTHAMLDEFGRSGLMGCLLGLVLQSEFSTTPHLAAVWQRRAAAWRFLALAIAGTYASPRSR